MLTSKTAIKDNNATNSTNFTAVSGGMFLLPGQGLASATVLVRTSQEKAHEFCWSS